MPAKVIIGIDIREALNPKKAGKGEYAYHLVEELIKLSQKRKTTSLVLFNDDRFTPPKRWQKLTQTIKANKLSWHKKVAKYCAKENIRTYFSPTSYITPYYISKLSPQTKTLVTVHDLIVFLHPKSHPLKPRLAEQFYLRKITQSPNVFFTTVSNSTKHDLIQVFPNINTEKILVAKNGLKNLSPNKIKIKSPKRPFILSVSTILPRKNYLTLLKAFNYIKEELPHNLHIIGKGDPKNVKPLQQFIQKNNLQKRVKLLGYVSSEKLIQEYKTADMLVIPSMYEGFGLPVIEGLKRGLPVICSDIPVFHEVADPAALFFDPTNPIDLANQLIFLHKNQEQKDILKVEGPKLVKKYSWSKTAQKIWKQLNQLAKN
jgi:glycosyltransferase involved in cell wall biosynthesis